jgi:gliding motility-associated-like protein
VVTAGNGVTTKTYTVIATEAKSSNANLAGLKPGTGAISPVFAPATTNYTETVNYAVSSISITPTTAVSTATVTVNGTAVASGTASAPISLGVGANVISTVVTAQDGVTFTKYTLTITRSAALKNAQLSALALSSGVLSPAFAPTTIGYTASEVNGVALITITPSTADVNATVTVNGVAVTSGSTSQNLPLVVGANTITVVVTAQDGTTKKTYTTTVTEAPSTNANLANIVLSNGVLSPAFSKGTTGYTDNVGNGLASMTITPTAGDPAQTIIVNGTAVTSGSASQSLPLVVGPNTITVVATAQDGVTSKTYTIVVTEAQSTNDNLLALKPNTGSMSPVFSPATTTYTESVSNTISRITITPTTVVSSATITVNGTAVLSGTVSGPINLAVGANVITTIVTAQSGVTKTYTLTVTRAASGADSYVPIAIGTGISVSKPSELPAIVDDGILVHQGVSPNGDGINDFLQIDNISQYPDNKLSIMNRNGQLIYETKGYDNNAKVFDGHSNKNGQMQLPGTYFYQLDYTVSGITKHKTGFIVLKY